MVECSSLVMLRKGNGIVSQFPKNSYSTLDKVKRGEEEGASSVVRLD